jgi:hypothetical protein
MRILVGCEESQAVTKELRKLGHDAYSCDILDCSGGKPEWHIKGDILPILKQNWDMLIAFPPCTYLAVSGAAWFYHPDDFDLDIKDRRPHPKHPNRKKFRKDALKFVTDLMNAPIERIAIENPIGSISTYIRKPDQIIQPWQFGDKAQKSTCLWLKNLPKLKPTNIVEKGEFFEWIDSRSGKKKRQPLWFYQALQKAKTPEERRTLRSKTFPGIAEAMAKQWTKGKFLKQLNLFEEEKKCTFNFNDCDNLKHDFCNDCDEGDNYEKF